MDSAPALRSLAQSLLRLCPEDGPRATLVPGVHAMRYSSGGPPARRPWHAALALVAQGCKELSLGDRMYRCREGHYTAAPVPLAVVSRIVGATPKRPFLALMVELTPSLVAEVSALLEGDDLGTSERVERAFFTAKADMRMLEAAERLARLLDAPKDARVLGPLLVRELLVHLLMGSEGPALRRFVRAGSASHRVFEAVHRLNANVASPLDVSDLAKGAHMSRSAFFKGFKNATSMSPVQYQKRLRLMEAQRILKHEGGTVEAASYKVGYASASQFSREYARMFKQPPSKDSRRHQPR